MGDPPRENKEDCTITPSMTGLASSTGQKRRNVAAKFFHAACLAQRMTNDRVSGVSWGQSLKVALCLIPGSMERGKADIAVRPDNEQTMRIVRLSRCRFQE